MDLKDPKTQKLILMGAGIGVLVYFYLIANYVPFNYPARAKEISTLKDDYTQKMSELTKAQQLVNRLPELKKEFELLNQRWTVAQELLPSPKEAASLLRKAPLPAHAPGAHFPLFTPPDPKPSTYFP